MFYKTAIKISGIIFFTALLSCQGRKNINTTINEKNNELSIRVDANKNGETIHYNKSFDTKGMTKPQRDSIVHHVFDSLHIGINESK
jgi:hypothetical protein